MFVPRYYEDLTTLHVGCEPDRAYFVPASAPIDTTFDRRTDSDRFQLLNGDWSFLYYESIHDLDAEVSAALDAYDPVFTDVAFDMGAEYTTVPVPSVWQMHGFDRNQYTNVRYPFPFDPPFVPADDPCAVYRTVFDYAPDARAPRAYLNFEGVDSCWINFFDPDKLAQALALPENEEVLMVMDLGYAAEGAGPLSNHSSRKPLSETVSYI